MRANMKTLLIPLLGILALAGTACEQHSAEELRGAHGKNAQSQEAPGNAGAAASKPATFTPDTIPQNPAGAGPVGNYEAAKPDPAESGTPPKYFPKK